ncbi:MAG TPA: ParB N-terminal domain-containing protein [Leptospiraceae bacterium]|nr:ParB N-terminal domain-containing protein [Leptospiraceae bacterium]
MSNIFTKSFLVLLKAVKAARGGKYVHRELIGTVTDKKGKIRNKWKYFYNQGTLQKELAEWKAQFEAKQAKQKKNLFATSADIKNVQQRPDQKVVATSMSSPKEQPTSSQVEPVQQPLPKVSFDEHLASQNLTPKQLEVSKQVYNTVKDLPESELRLRLDRLSKLPPSNGIAGITAINYVLGLSRSEAMLGNQNAKKDVVAKQENNFDTMPEQVANDINTTPKPVSIKERVRKRVAEIKKEKAVSQTLIDDIDNPNSPNYRFKDTGFVAGARKFETAGEYIKKSSRNGVSLKVSDIDFDDLEKNPREAKQLITKSHLFGNVDWDSLKTSMEPAAGFLIDRVYSSIPKEPKEDTPEMRKSYTMALQTLRERLEKSKTVENVLNTLTEIFEERNGFVFNEQETGILKNLKEALIPRQEGKVAFDEKKDQLYKESNNAYSIKYKLEWDLEKRNRKGWDTKEVLQKLELAKKDYETKLQAWRDFLKSDPYYSELEGDSQYDKDRREYSRKYNEFKLRAMERQMNSDIFKTWDSLGNDFQKYINYKSYHGSKSFQTHVTNAKAGRIKDWSWLDKNNTEYKKAKQSEVTFTFKVAEKFDRVGGKPIKVESTKELKELFGLREVQSGNWVLNDLASASFHTQKTAEAFSDLSDILGIDAKSLSLDGQLAIAFGARGAGLSGAKAHYEPVQRIINITKMGGGGSLAHEWFHAVDNLVNELITKTPTSQTFFGSENIQNIQNEKVKNAFSGLVDAMTKGDVALTKEYSYTDKDYQTAQYNLANISPYTSSDSLKFRIAKSKDVNEAIRTINEKFKNVIDKRGSRMKKQWTQIAIAWHGKSPIGGTLVAETGEKVSNFLADAKNIIGRKEYWDSITEMGARAFQSFVEDKLANNQRQNDYLSCFADNRYYTFPIVQKPFPEGEERIKINNAFDELFKALKGTGAFAKMSEIMKAYRMNQNRNNYLTLLKGKKAQEGEVRTWGNGKQFKKVGGKWQPVNEGKKKATPKEKKEKKKGTGEANTGFSMKPFAEIKRIAQYTKEADFDKEKIEQYKNSILEHGYDPAFPMVIDKDKKTGAYNVVAGNHRYKAVEALINEGKLPKDFQIPTVMREFEDENARLAYQVRENQRRDPLPTDEANAYKKMADNGWDAARIAKELGQPVGKIQKRLALSNLSPDLFNLVSKKGIPVGIAEAIGLGSVEEESGKPNHTIQLKAYQFYRDNKGKGYGAGEVLSFIRELKSNASQKFFENDGKSDTEKEALRNVGSEEKAKRNVKMLDNTFKTIQKALSNLMGDSVGQINPKLAKELSASIVAAQGESEFSNKMKMLDTVIQDMTLMKEAFLKSFKGMKEDSSMGMMFASAINSMIHEVNKHTKAIETAKGINKMLSLAYKAKYKLHDQSVKARLAA